MTADHEILLLLNAYQDGELSPGEALAMERRLDADPALRALAGRLGPLSKAVQGALATPRVPEDLRARIVQQFGVSDAAVTRQSPRSALRRSPAPWQALAAMLLIGLLGGGLIGGGATYLGLASGRHATSDAVLAGHLRGLIAPQPYDIASSNRHVVKPWFNGRTTIAPEAPDFAERGFPLAGGRIDIVDGTPVPTLVYRHDQHVVSVTVAPRTSEVPTGEERRNGSTIEHWNAGDLTYWAVSDLAARDLRGFVDLYRAQTAPAGARTAPAGAQTAPAGAQTAPTR